MYSSLNKCKYLLSSRAMPNSNGAVNTVPLVCQGVKEVRLQTWELQTERRLIFFNSLWDFAFEPEVTWLQLPFLRGSTKLPVFTAHPVYALCLSPACSLPACSLLGTLHELRPSAKAYEVDLISFGCPVRRHFIWPGSLEPRWRKQAPLSALSPSTFLFPL